MKIMLFSDIPPCKNYTAGIVLNIMCDFLLEAGHELSCFTVKNKFVDAVIPEDKRARMAFAGVVKPQENWGSRKPTWLTSFCGNNATALFRLPKIAGSAADFARDQGAELIWCVVQGQTMIRLVRPMVKRANLPYVIQIWDPPHWWMREYRVDALTTRMVLDAYGRAIHRAECCITASWAMNEAYEKQYRCPRNVPVILGFPPERVQPAGIKQADEFVIALSGQVYAAEEITALCAALDRLDWRCDSRKLILRLYGREFNLPCLKSPHVENCGWVEQVELLPLLATADLLYCPYWFSEAYYQPAAFSFPSKLSTYLKTGIPVFLHGPEYASPRKFVEQHRAGYVCGTLDPDQIATQLTEIIKDPRRAAVGERGYQAFLENLTLTQMKDHFFSALHI